MRNNPVQEHLKEVEHQLLRCEAFVNSVRANIRLLEGDGRDASEARELLSSYESSQTRLKAARDRLRTALARLERSSEVPAE
jgi:hypothetical protein